MVAELSTKPDSYSRDNQEEQTTFEFMIYNGKSVSSDINKIFQCQG